jgi:hypothetical protein
MQQKLLVLALLVLGAFAAVSNERVQEGLAAIERLRVAPDLVEFVDRLKHPFPFKGKDQSGVECAVCDMGVNAVEGFIAEGKTEAEIEVLIKDYICVNMTFVLKEMCRDFADHISEVVTLLENHNNAGEVCAKLGYCSGPDPYHKDLFAVPNYQVDLDAPPAQRWGPIWTKYYSSLHEAIDFVTSIVSADTLRDLEITGRLLNDVYPAPFGDEIRGAAASVNISDGLIGVANIAYELTDLCTSIVAQTTSGQILHVRNLDFGAGMGFTDLLRNMTFSVDFVRNGTVVYRGASYAGIVGLLSVMRPGAFAITVDTKFTKPLWDMLKEIVEALTVNGASEVSFFVRQVAETQTSYASALSVLVSQPLCAEVYLIMSGVSTNQGVVVTRTLNNATDVWSINPAVNNTWFVIETNYDHWEPAPWFDNRVYYATQAMLALGPQQVTLPGMLNDVLSLKPVLNKMTTYSILMRSANNSLTLYGRYCNDPCPM